MAVPVPVIVGVDVGGTNTDAVVISKKEGEGHRILAEDKHVTTSDVTKGVHNAVLSVLRQATGKTQKILVKQINIGTTHFVNAVVQRKHLSRVSLIRLCGPASRAVPLFADFPPSLRDVIYGSVHFVDGGYRVEGREIESICEEEIKGVVEEIRKKGVKGIVVCGIFSPNRTEQEEQVKKLITGFYPEASITLSHTIGHIGLLERENAAILNEALKELCQRTVSGFRQALKDIGLTCPMFLTQNDGTVISEEAAKDCPVFTFASGPTNSMQGAAFLCQLTDALVVDIGGTTTDVGVLKNRFPRQASTDVRVGGVRTNFRMPDMHSVGLGGGSYVVKTETGKTLVGPLSAGYNITKEALVFSTDSDKLDPQSGRRMTATDVAVAAGLMDLGDKKHVAHIPPADVSAALRRIQQIVEDAINSVRVSDEPLPVILVGGGSKLLDFHAKMPGVSQILLPEHYGVANAIGAALCQVSGSVHSVVPLDNFMDTNLLEARVLQAKRDLPPGATQDQVDEAVKAVRKPLLEAARDRAVQEVCSKARQMALQAGADPSTVEIVQVDEVALAYLPRSAVCIKVKAVGDLVDSASLESMVPWTEPPGVEILDTCITTDVTKQQYSVTGGVLDPSQSDSGSGARWRGLAPSRPVVDSQTGEWILNAWDLECIAVGAGILGAGGGGSPHIGRIRAHAALEKGDKIGIAAPERLLARTSADAHVVTVAFMGAPLVIYEQLLSGQELPNALRCMEDLYRVGGYTEDHLVNTEGVEIKEKEGVVYIDDYQPVTSHAGSAKRAEGDGGKGGDGLVGLLCAEIGGLNSIEPLLVSAAMGLPVVDGDGMGRAFPMLQMLLPFIHGEKAHPAAVVDDKGRRAVLLKADNPRQVEDHFRTVCMQMGSSAGVTFAAFKNSVVMDSTIIRSYSRAWTIGDSILCARKSREDPVEALMRVEDAKALIVGKVCDVRRETSGAFNKGHVRIEGTAYEKGREREEESVEGGDLCLRVDFQNENLLVRKVSENGDLEVLAVVPDVISIVDAVTVEPIPTEQVRYGQRVMVLVLPAPPRLVTPHALTVVGPAAFGFPDVQYTPLGCYREPTPLAPL